MRAPSLLFALGVCVAPLACGDPVHDAQVAALGGDTPGGPGPLHRPGQPCLTCHGGQGPASRVFSIAGTVYLVKGQDAPAVGALLVVEDASPVQFGIPTNRAGNFFVAADDWQPAFPIQPEQVQLGSVVQQMLTHVGRSGSCADCHKKPLSSTSPGPVYIATTASGLPAGVSP